METVVALDRIERKGFLKHIDLFSGIGGFALAAKRNGIETVLFCEIDKFCRRVLNKNFPGTYVHGDIHTLTKEIIYEHTASRELILTGGFPCQPFSQVGKRKGSEDERALFPQIIRIVNEIKPKWMVLENVYGILNIHDGDYYESEVTAQLENSGYSVQSFIIPASSVGAWHRRDRVWFVCRRTSDITKNTVSNGQPNKRRQTKSKFGKFGLSQSGNGERVHNVSHTGRKHESGQTHKANIGKAVSEKNASKFERSDRCDGIRTFADTTSEQSQSGFLGEFKESKQGQFGRGTFTGSWDTGWYEVAARFCRIPDGLSEGLYKLETSDRLARLKALGNSIVPQVADIIFKTILEIDNNKQG